MQYVSSTPATRLDVINLQEKLDQQLQQRQVSASSAHQYGCFKAASGLKQRSLM